MVRTGLEIKSGVLPHLAVDGSIPLSLPEDLASELVCLLEGEAEQPTVQKNDSRTQAPVARAHPLVMSLPEPADSPPGTQA